MVCFPLVVLDSCDRYIRRISFQPNVQELYHRCYLLMNLQIDLLHYQAFAKLSCLVHLFISLFQQSLSFSICPILD
jgi:hypothetical protein